jgi:hypothetical protein
MEVFYGAMSADVGAESTGTFDSCVFGTGGEWENHLPELVLKGQTVEIMSGFSDGLRTTIAHRPLPDTVEELIDWARMVHAVHTQPS